MNFSYLCLYIEINKKKEKTNFYDKNQSSLSKYIIYNKYYAFTAIFSLISVKYPVRIQLSNNSREI